MTRSLITVAILGITVTLANCGHEAKPSKHHAKRSANLQYKRMIRKPAPAQDSVIIAIIDTGADVEHPELRDSLWTNPGEVGLIENCLSTDPRACDRSRNGLDDDGNGYIDDVHGWSFASSSQDLTDRHGHGTHIAGIVRTAARDANVKLMILKYYDPKISNALGVENTIEAIEYAVAMGAKIINYSAGGMVPNARERLAIEAASKKGVLFVAAAGNEAMNSDNRPYYPADYDLANVVSVTAIDANSEVLESSNYGEESVDLAAPGSAIQSALPKNKYGFMTGTSQATAYVSGVAALVLQSYPELNEPEDLKNHLMLSGQLRGSLVGKTKTSQEVDSFRALQLQGPERDVLGTVIANTSGLDPRLFTTDDN